MSVTGPSLTSPHWAEPAAHPIGVHPGSPHWCAHPTGVCPALLTPPLSMMPARPRDQKHHHLLTARRWQLTNTLTKPRRCRHPTTRRRTPQKHHNSPLGQMWCKGPWHHFSSNFIGGHYGPDDLAPIILLICLTIFVQHGMKAKLTKTLELQYPIMQFLCGLHEA